jgi:hypothetical protein
MPDAGMGPRRLRLFKAVGAPRIDIEEIGGFCAAWASPVLHFRGRSRLWPVQASERAAA